MTDLILPVPPSTNSLFRNVARIGRVKTDKYREWIKEAGWALKSQTPKTVKGDVSISIRVPMNRRRDIDNYAKAILDLLVNHELIEDDNRVVALVLHKDSTLSTTTRIRYEEVKA